MKRSSFSQLFEIDDRHVEARERASVAWRARAPSIKISFYLTKFPTTMVLWCSWLSLLSNTQAVLSSSLSGIIVLLLVTNAFWLAISIPKWKEEELEFLEGAVRRGVLRHGRLEQILASSCRSTKCFGEAFLLNVSRIPVFLHPLCM